MVPVPELPDVAEWCRLFTTHMLGEPVTSVVVRNPTVVRGRSVEEFVQGLEGQRFEKPFRHGKWLLAGTKGPTLLLHFGMTGRLRWEPRESQALPFDRVDLCLRNGKLVFQDQRNLGGLWLAESQDEVRELVGDLGPDALEFTAHDMEERFAGSRTLKATLMDQSVLAGLGNMLSDEVLWRARIHPARLFDDLDPDQVQDLAHSLRRVLRAAVKAGEIPRRPAWLASQRSRADPRCPRCRTELRTDRIAGRTSYSCPVCQGAPGKLIGSLL
jgi:formamidopyrimidine-DNA glycosylase